jgi:endogenous inhibitor of DNA gyrase (YacG/DUF329 family)
MTPSNHAGGNRPRQLREFRCPTCKRVIKLPEKDASAQMKFFPFCSERCKLIDLGAWLDADYRIASEGDSEAEGPSQEDSSTPSKPS